MNDTKKPAGSAVLVLVLIPREASRDSGSISSGTQSRTCTDAYRTGWDNVFARNGSSAPN